MNQKTAAVTSIPEVYLPDALFGDSPNQSGCIQVILIDSIK